MMSLAPQQPTNDYLRTSNTPPPFLRHGGGDAWDNNNGEDYLMMVEDAALRKPVTAAVRRCRLTRSG